MIRQPAQRFCLLALFAVISTLFSHAAGPAAVPPMVLMLDKEDDIKLEMLWIPPGSFDMGSAANTDEQPVHKVLLPRGFWMGKFELTQEQFRALTARNPATQEGDKLPAHQLSWNDAHEFLAELNKLHRAPAGYIFRLPSEAEFEYACRAGTKTAYYTGDTPEDLGRAGWFLDNSGKKVHPGGQKAPNAFGLYDMLGNVSEWCLDLLDKYPATAQTEPFGPPKGNDRVVRGGSFVDVAQRMTATFRRGSKKEFRYGYVGFRVVCGPAPR